MTLAQHPFEIPDHRKPKKFAGFVCVLYAGERYFSGCDTNSADDAYWSAVYNARRSMQVDVAVDKSLDPSVWAETVQMYRVKES